ncbi:NAD(P)H-dependent oxidoreductase [Wenyingzhuangia fucanilytica]|uniref:NAD(P)H-dependent oxidoreductase n=1 Tax=Wenyingzhuangia fucanilytica TaxID=1790137 RepID=A0A1B1Y302_9FLAO|nr:NAD(P)H-dependent oxidoreductase [Wenyingzhuangia fucanilytica]ANW95153.1 NAD(P)H-dependent oxidoreductase [Wenyingzhuangia fucanilytica]
MNIIESLEWRYATKKFDNTKKLSKEQLQTIKKAFNLTATSYGLQTLSLVIVETPEIREQLLPHAFNQKQIIDASHLLVLCYPNDFDGANVEEYFNRVKKKRNTPDEILKPFRDFLMNDFDSKSELDKHKTFIHQTYIALGNLLTVCALEKIDSCPMEGFNPAKFDEVLKLKEKNLKSALLLPVGFRAKDDFMAKEKKVRKSLSEIIIEI